MALFENITGSSVVDCLIDDGDGKIVFVIKKGYMGLAIGRNGCNIERVKKSIGKQVEVIEHSDNMEKFIANIFSPINIKKVEIVDNRNHKRTARIAVNAKDKGLAIGRDGKNIQRAKLLIQRHHNIDDAVIQ